MSLSSKSKLRIKWIFNLVLIVSGTGLIIGLFLLKGSMNNFISKKMADQADIVVKTTISQVVDSVFNYRKNGKAYKITFLEFGATGCISCRKMELVMKEVREKHPQTVNVVFYNVLKPESRDFMKYYGVASIPTQVLLDPSGKEFFRHTGYLSLDELEKELIKSNQL